LANTEAWKNQKMQTAGHKAHVTRLRNAGQVEEADKLEKCISQKGLTENVSSQMAVKVIEDTATTLKQVHVSYNVPYIRGKVDDGLPWIEKYRPQTLADLQGPVACYLRAFVKMNSFPLAMVFFGDYGVGKTAGMKAFVRDYFVKVGAFKAEATFNDVKNGVNWTSEFEGSWSPILYVDATLSANIDSVTDSIHNFMCVRSIWNSAGLKLKKMVAIDEADRLGYQSQGKLRSLLEKYPGTVTLYTTNKIGGIDPAIISRASGGVFEFKKPSKDELMKYLRELLKLEHVRLSDEVLEEIAVGSASVRDSVGKLQQEAVLKQCQGD
jgi:replication factor C subunit 3/5